MKTKTSENPFPVLSEMTLDEKLGQMLVTGLPGEDMDQSFVRLVKEDKVGNVILFRENIRDEEQVRELCLDIQSLMRRETGFPAFITSDEEGGIVSRLPETMGRMPSAMAIAGLCSQETVRRAAECCGQYLRELGINFNLAPVLDVNSNPANPVIGVRSYARTAVETGTYGCAAMKGYMDAGILCSGKHFPGHGDTRTDSHLALPVIGKSREELEKLELIPFKEAVAQGIPAITIAHIVVEGVDSVPATMSERIVTGILKRDMGFSGLVISDCMEMNAISKTYGIEEGCIRAVKAGIDLIFISHFHDKVRSTLNALKEAVLSGDIPISRIDDAVSRILDYKKKYLSEDTRCAQSGEAYRQMTKELYSASVREAVRSANKEEERRFCLGESPCFIAPPHGRASLVSDKEEAFGFASYMQKCFGGTGVDISMSPEKDEIDAVLHKARKADSVVVGTVNATVYTGQMELLRSLEKLGLPMACAALRNPFELEEMSSRVYKLPLYEYTGRAMKAAEEYLRS